MSMLQSQCVTLHVRGFLLLVSGMLRRYRSELCCYLYPFEETSEPYLTADLTTVPCPLSVATYPWLWILFSLAPSWLWLPHCLQLPYFMSMAPTMAPFLHWLRLTPYYGSSETSEIFYITSVYPSWVFIMVVHICKMNQRIHYFKPTWHVFIYFNSFLCSWRDHLLIPSPIDFKGLHLRHLSWYWRADTLVEDLYTFTWTHDMILWHK